MQIQKSKVAHEPHIIPVTANRLAEFAVAGTPARRKSIVRRAVLAYIHGTPFPPYYVSFKKPAQQYFVSGLTNENILNRAVKSLDSRNSTEWLARDSRLTQEAIKRLLEMSPDIRELGLGFEKPVKPNQAKIRFDDVVVSVSPNLLVFGERNGKPLFGAARFYMAKESPYQLGKVGAELVATMEYLWAVSVSTGAKTPDPALCLVFEIMQLHVTPAPADVSHRISQLQRAAREFAILWRSLYDTEAA